MKTWKHGITGIIALIAITVITLSACSSLVEEDEGSLIINLSASSGRSAMPWPPDEEGILNDINYEITLSGKGKTIPITAKGGETIRATVSAGRWNVDVKAYYQDNLYATGNNSVDVKAKRDNPVSIQMHKAFDDAVALVGITALYSHSEPVHASTPLDHLKQYLTVTAAYSDGSEKELDAEDYELSGELTAGALCTITVTYEEETDTFDVEVSPAALVGITAVYSNSETIIYTSTPLDSLKQYLAVTATYDNGEEEELDADEYTLSGELTAGTPVITVHFGGESDTFTPAVAAVVLLRITVEYTSTTEIFTDTTLDTLREGLAVTAYYSDGAAPRVTDYALIVAGGALIIGDNTVTVTYGGETGAFSVTVYATHPHIWSKISETGPTCTTAGVEVWECTYTTPPHHEDRPGAAIDPTAHVWNNSYTVTTPATCMATGIETDTCSLNVSHTRMRDIAIDPNAHNWNNNFTVTTPATCSLAGIATDTCSLNVSHTRPQTVAIDPNAHNWNNNYTVTTPATCMATGIETDTCSLNVSHTRTQTVAINPNAHNWNNTYTVTTPATCMATGIETDTCSLNVSHTRTQTVAINPNAHVWNNTYTVTTSATCTTEGEETDTCSLNVLHTRRQPVDIDLINGHNWQNWTEDQPTDGIETRICSRDNLHKQTRVKMAMVSVPGGTFQLGKEVGAFPGGSTDTRPVSNVTLSGFNIGKYEVTQAQWLALMGRTQEEQQALKDPEDTSNYGRGNSHPVYYLSWYDAVEFCNALSVAEGLSPYYTVNKEQTDPYNTSPNDTFKWLVTLNANADGYRLPTEAQWEYAAKGGNPLAPGWVGYTFAGSDAPGDVAWFYNSTSSDNTYVVGTKAPNGLGLHDMSGNVMEWCWDRGGNYSEGDKYDPTGTSSAGPYRIVRGGSWISQWPDIRSVNRMPGVPSPASYLVGFRVVLPVWEEGVGGITASVWHAGNAPSTTAPTVFVASGNMINAQGWQTSDDGTSGWTDFTDTTAEMSHNGKYLRYYATISGTTYYSRNTVRISVISPVSNIASAIWREDTAISFTAPTVTGTPSAQGWRISEDGESGWTNFTATTADISHNGKYLRYYATVSGTTYYSNTVPLTVISATDQLEVTIDMYDSYGDGWDSGGLRININGTDFITVSPPATSRTYTFMVDAGDVVQIYWVAAYYPQYQGENSFIAYYTIAPPSPAFPPHTTSWSGSNALVYRLHSTMTNMPGGTLLGSFTVP